MPNGFVYRNLLADGKGQLTVSNGTDSHAVAKLVDSQQERSLLTFLIRAGNNVTIPRVPDGSYRLLFALGKGWNDEKQQFYEGHRYAEFERSLVFRTTQKTEGDRLYEYYSRLSVTLHRVIDGTAKTNEIAEAEFATW